MSVESQCQSMADLQAAPTLHVAGQAGLRVEVQTLGGVVVLETVSGPVMAQAGGAVQGIFAHGDLGNQSPLANTSMGWLLPSWLGAAAVHVALQRDQRPTLAPVMTALADHVAAVRAQLTALLAQLQLGLAAVGSWSHVRSVLTRTAACDPLAVCWVQNAGLGSALEILQRVQELTKEADIANTLGVPPGITTQLADLIAALETDIPAAQSVSVFSELLCKPMPMCTVV